MIGLNTLAPAQGAKHRKIRVGRGVGSGRGRMCTRGMNGQKKRSGESKMSWFEGGQMSIVRRMPKRGHSISQLNDRYEIVNLSSIESKFEANAEINGQTLKDAGILKKGTYVKVLANGDITKKFIVKANAFSKSAQEKIEKVGGKVEIIK
jgi:large subunit ribosomal protein L15